MKRLWFIAISLMVVVQSWAGPVTEDEARQKASRFLKGRMSARARGSAPAAKDLKMMETGPEDTYFIFNVGNNEGFVVVSGDDTTEEILGYGDMGSLDSESMPCNMRMLFNTYSKQIKLLRDSHAVVKKGETRASSGKSFHIDKKKLAKYAQGRPYYNSCPKFSDKDQHTLTGCAATAMAELMYYYKWPNKTTNDIQGYITNTNKLIVDPIPANTVIDWSNIIKQYNTYYREYIFGKYIADELWDTEEQADAIANLMTIAGSSVHMDYGEVSSAYNCIIPYALKKYFGYESANWYVRSFYTHEEWNNKLCNNLENNGPVLYYGTDNLDNGHFFLLEGYEFDNDYYYDINFGEDGLYNSQFLLTVVDDAFTYTENQSAVLDVKPKNVLEPSDIPLKLTTIDIRSTDNYIYSRSKETNQFEEVKLWAKLRNVSPIDSYFNHGFRIIPYHNPGIPSKDIVFREKTWMASMGKNGRMGEDVSVPNDSYNDGKEYSFSVGDDVEDGFYLIYCISKQCESTEWLPNDFAWWNDLEECVGATICNNTVAFKSLEEDKSILQLVDVIETGTSAIIKDQPCKFTYIVKNLHDIYYYGDYILIVAEWKEGDVEINMPIAIDEEQVNARGYLTSSFTFTPPAVGDINIVFYKKDWTEIGRRTVKVIAVEEYEDMLKVKGINVDNLSSDGSIDGTYINGKLSLYNQNEKTIKEKLTVKLEDAETGVLRSKTISININSNESMTYSFMFTNLIENHHYSVSLEYENGLQFYKSEPLLCTNDDTGETIPGNENLTSYEYWFDDDFAGRQTINLNSSSEAIKASIETDHLEDGVHRLHFRLFQSGLEYPYSSITSSTFLKLSKEKEQILEYWVDDDYEHRSNVPVEMTEEEQLLTLDLSQASIGNHQLNMQLSLPGGVKSHVYTQGVMKLASGVADELEYWFDNDIQHSQRLKGRYSSSDKVYIYNTDIDLSSLSQGFHLLNMRAVSNNGVTKGSVLSCHVLKLPTGNATKLEYWFDEDRKNHGFLTGKLSGNDIVFNENVNINGLESGHHRLYYRSISENGQKSGAISMTPVLIKSAYAHLDSDNNKVVKYSIEIDDEEQAYLDVLSPQEEVVIPYTVDARNQSEGSHTLKARFWNTANAGVTVEQAFTVIGQETPELTLTAEESNGLVNLAFVAVPNDLRYRIIRTDANGAKAKVDSKEGTSYPGTISFTDNPAAGSYTYYAETVYTDFSGNRHTLQSNEVSVTVTAPQTEVEAEQFGYIIGHIVCDKNTPTYGVKVRFSDGKMAPGTYFMRNRIPVGEELTLTVEGDDTHEYEEVTVVVEEGENFVTIRGRLREEYQPNNLAYDLAICSAIEVTFENGQHHAKFCVTNLSTANKWKGRLQIDAVKTDLTTIQALLGNKPTYHRSSDKIEIKANETKELDVVLRDMDLDDETNFDLFIWSEGSWQRSGMEDETKEKSLAFFQTPGLSEFPISVTFPESLIQHDWNKEAQEAYAYLMLGLNSMTPGMEGKVGNLEPFQKEVISVTGAKNAFSTLIDWLGGKTALEAINEPNLFNISSAVKGAYDKVMSNVRPPLVQKYLKSLVKKVSSEATANAMINSTTLAELSSLTTAVTSKDRFDQSMACASMLYRLAADNTVPIASMIYTYTVAGRTLINAAKELHKALHDQQLADRLVKNKRRSQPKEITNNGVRYTSYNTTCDFKLKVKTDGIFGGVINFKDIKKKIGKGNFSDPIKEIYIGASNTSKVQRYLFDREYLDDGIMLRLREGSSSDITDGVKGVINGGGDNYLTRFFMEIHWSNGRITYIPLNELGDGVEAKLGGHTSAEDGDNDLTPSLYTVTLTTTKGEDSMADELYLGDNEERE